MSGKSKPKGGKGREKTETQEQRAMREAGEELCSRQKELERLRPHIKFNWGQLPESLEEIRTQLSRMEERIKLAREKRQSGPSENRKLNQVTHPLPKRVAKTTKPPEPKSDSDETLQETIRNLRAQLADATEQNRRPTGIMGKISIAPFDKSEDGKRMNKDDAIAKWPKWKRCLQVIRSDKSLNPQLRKEHLLSSGGQYIRDIDDMIGIDIDVESGDVFEDFIAKIDKFLQRDEAMLVHARSAFARLAQQKDESVDSFWHRLQIALTPCDWDLVTATTKIRDQIAAYARPRPLVFQMIADGKSVEEILTRCRLHEAGAKEQREFEQSNRPTSVPLSVLAVDNNRTNNYSNDFPNKRFAAERRQFQDRGQFASGSKQNMRQTGFSGNRDASKQKKYCAGCGDNWHINRSDCPAFNEICQNCDRRGHRATVCRQQKRHGPNGGQINSLIAENNWDDWPEGGASKV